MTQKKEKKIDLEALEPEELMKYEIAGELGVSREEVAASLEAGAQVESLYQTPGRDGEGGSCLLESVETPATTRPFCWAVCFMASTLKSLHSACSELLELA